MGLGKGWPENGLKGRPMTPMGLLQVVALADFGGAGGGHGLIMGRGIAALYCPLFPWPGFTVTPGLVALLFMSFGIFSLTSQWAPVG